ncbi:type I-E CRISPR-associated protein Cas6/Cse3/CasE [Actinocorallia sp. API 0066]|uniref:type I-E CRISPR-associated protein Cas6/Cse3/CasE n=1 Tax=Actinocorallia sp. API 0066 TaxID=2896846 RepID=UPI001E5DFE6C|nr:type I-E CRISPR-associated protein Cas6/Cse3/CasE [Actinocorallia sp. API 0066]MCD0452839.1 type I-E CRISPR-associated protein Cas6/Cse3/CasE [Actinocorallia sp. API 0066]
MTYLSRIRINPLRAESRKMLASPRVMHAAVCAGIPATPDTERILWRLDADNPHRPVLFVLTRSRPDWKHLVESAGWPDAEGEHAAIRDYLPLLDRVAVGREFAFRLTASPVQNTKRPQKATPSQEERLKGELARGFRIPHRTAQAQLGWLLARTGRCGFDIPPARTDPPIPDIAEPDSTPAPEVRLIGRDHRSFTKPGLRQPIVIRTATFEGRLRVTDTARFTQSLLDGIGPAKAYGCGLLTLAPLPGSR